MGLILTGVSHVVHSGFGITRGGRLESRWAQGTIDFQICSVQFLPFTTSSDDCETEAELARVDKTALFQCWHCRSILG